MNLKHKQVLITGGAKGIGLATAKRILNEGANVIIWDFKEDDLLQTVRDLKEQGHNVFSQICDVTNKEQVYQNAAIIKEKFGEEKPYLGQKGYFPHQNPRAAYAAMISYLDENIGKLIMYLKDKNLYYRHNVFLYYLV